MSSTYSYRSRKVLSGNEEEMIYHMSNQLGMSGLGRTIRCRGVLLGRSGVEAATANHKGRSTLRHPVR